MSLIKALAAVGGLTFISRVAGFARDLVISHTMGAGPIADAFFVALKLPNFFRSITAEGAFSISFVPLYTEKKTKDGTIAATDFTNAALSMMMAILLPFSIMVMWGMPIVILILAPGFAGEGEKLALAVDMARLSFPYLMLVTLAAMLGAVLNAHQKFGPYAFAPVLFNLCLIVSVVFTPLFETQGHAMAAFMSISGALQALWVWMFIRKMGLQIKFVRPRLTPDLRRLFRLMGPGILVASVFQINLFTNMMIASFAGSGAISHLYYADRLYQLPFGVIGIAVGTALLPMFAQALADKNAAETQNLYNRSVEYMLILCLPCAFGLLIAADPIIRTIYLHGAFGGADVQATALVLMAYALGLPAYVLTRIYNAAFYAHQDTWSPVQTSIITTAVTIPLSILLALPFGAVGIALSTSIMGWVLLALLYRRAKTHGLDLRVDARLKRNFPRILFMTGLLIFILFMMRYGLEDFFRGTLPIRTLALAGLIIASILVYFPLLFITKIVPFSDVKRYLKRTHKGRIQNDRTQTD